MSTSDPDAELQAWFSVADHSYAVIDRQAVPQVEAMLGAQGAVEWDRLARSGAPADGSDGWCVQLTPGLPLSRWLLAGDGARLEDWGVLAFSNAPFRQVRNHLRDQLEARLPRGERITLRWYRPPVLRALLPLCGASQLVEFFGPVGAFAVADSRGWTWFRQVGGQLDTQTSPHPRARG